MLNAKLERHLARPHALPHEISAFIYIYKLVSKTLGAKCISTSICNVLANHDQNIESRFRLAQSVFICKIEIE